MNQELSLLPSDTRSEWQACLRTAIREVLAEAISDHLPRGVAIAHAVNGVPFVREDISHRIHQSLVGWVVTLRFEEEGFHLKLRLPDQEAHG